MSFKSNLYNVYKHYLNGSQQSQNQGQHAVVYFTNFSLYMTILLSVSFLCAVIDDYDYVFSENGLVAHKDGKLIGTQVLFTA